MAYSENQRRREIGVRMALGAGQASVLRLLLRPGMSLASSGIALGPILSILLGRVLSKFLYGVGASDPVSLGGASLVLLTVQWSRAIFGRDARAKWIHWSPSTRAENSPCLEAEAL
jgi:ABC-type antimicrobial peptide transport system permease subunit